MLGRLNVVSPYFEGFMSTMEDCMLQLSQGHTNAWMFFPDQLLSAQKGNINCPPLYFLWASFYSFVKSNTSVVYAKDATDKDKMQKNYDDWMRDLYNLTIDIAVRFFQQSSTPGLVQLIPDEVQRLLMIVARMKELKIPLEFYHRALNETQIQVITNAIKTPLMNIVDACKSDLPLATQILVACSEGREWLVPEHLLASVQQINKILCHKFPQNRRIGSPVTIKLPDRNIMVVDGIDSGYVHFYNADGDVVKEPQGLLALTARTEPGGLPVGRDEVVACISYLVYKQIFQLHRIALMPSTPAKVVSEADILNTINEFLKANAKPVGSLRQAFDMVGLFAVDRQKHVGVPVQILASHFWTYLQENFVDLKQVPTNLIKAMFEVARKAGLQSLEANLNKLPLLDAISTAFPGEELAARPQPAP